MLTNSPWNVLNICYTIQLELKSTQRRTIVWFRLRKSQQSALKFAQTSDEDGCSARATGLWREWPTKWPWNRISALEYPLPHHWGMQQSVRLDWNLQNASRRVELTEFSLGNPPNRSKQLTCAAIRETCWRKNSAAVRREVIKRKRIKASAKRTKVHTQKKKKPKQR